MINNKFLKKKNIFTTKTKEDKQKVEKIEVFLKIFVGSVLQYV